MATTIGDIKPARKHLQQLFSAAGSSKNKKIFVATSGAPAIDSGTDATTYPMKVGQLAVYHAPTTHALYVCTVAPEATTDATFVAIATY